MESPSLNWKLFLFEKAADPPKGNFEQSQVLNEFVECTMDSVSVENESGDGLRTKASKLFLKIIGDSEELSKFDNLRIKLKSLKRKPTTTEANEYCTLLAKLQSRILSMKYHTKDKIKVIDKQCMATQGKLDIQEYPNLYKQLQFIKRVLNAWKNFEM